jgi:hypothetical protein
MTPVSPGGSRTHSDGSEHTPIDGPVKIRTVAAVLSSGTVAARSYLVCSSSLIPPSDAMMPLAS